jgi:glycosyltransferase involved in cell wall biosynthesis
MTDERLGVLHLVDCLDVGGAETVAVNLVNALPREHYRVYLGTTRRDGPLAAKVRPDVGRLRLARRRRCDLAAVGRLASYIRSNQILIVHAHSTSVFIGIVAAWLVGQCKVIWHDHYGGQWLRVRPRWLYMPASLAVSGVVAVNQALAEWAIRALRVPAARVWYVPNFVPPPADLPHWVELPGQPGQRVVCVANFRPEKAHGTLLQAAAQVVRCQPHAHFLLVGGVGHQTYYAGIQQSIADLGLSDHVTLLGPRGDVPAILRACTIGVLSSASEGLPLALLEYGAAGLAAAATHVGQCAEVLDPPHAGLISAPNDPATLAANILRLLHTPGLRAELGAKLQARVVEHYSCDAAVSRIQTIYTLLASKPRAHAAAA